MNRLNHRSLLLLPTLLDLTFLAHSTGAAGQQSTKPKLRNGLPSGHDAPEGEHRELEAAVALRSPRDSEQAGPGQHIKIHWNRLAHTSSIWTFVIEHSGEHYGQLVVYCRANNLVPPDSRRQ